MQLGEAVDADIAHPSHDDDCYFCNANPNPTPNLNDLEAQIDEDSDFDAPEKFKNDARGLGKNMGGKPDERTIHVQGEPHASSVAPHHLIPGNGSLKESSFFKKKKYLWKDGEAKGNIGYNVNAASNGVWLPGNYAVRPWTGRSEPFQIDYSEAAMLEWRGQFHDAHESYNQFVEGVLNKIYDKLERQESIVCEKAKASKNNAEEDKDPLVALVSRLHTVSLRMRRMLVLPTSNWKANVWTSRFAKAFMSSRKEHLE
jgi:hypothetical protein